MISFAYFLRKPEVNAHFEGFFINIFNFSFLYLSERRLSLALKDITFSVKKPRDAGSAPPSSEAVVLETMYQATSFKIEEVSLSEYFLVGETEQQITAIKTKLVAYIYDCVYSDHPVYVNKKIHAAIPYLHVHVDDNLVLLCEVMKSLKNCDPKSGAIGRGRDIQDSNIFADISESESK